MSYQTGTALHIDDLLSKLSTFAQANGWTQNKIVAGSGDGASSELYLSKGASYFIFKAYLATGNNTYHGVFQAIDHPFLRIWGATGHDGGQPAHLQPNSSSTSENSASQVNWLLPNMTAYHFFTDPAQTYLHVVVETTANEFRHFAVGLSNKLGAYDGGEYVISHVWDQSTIGIDSPGYVGHAIPFHSGGNTQSFKSRFHCNVDGVRWKSYAFETANTSIVSPWVAGWTQGMPLDNMVNGVTNTSKVCTPQSFNDVSPLFNISCGWIVRSTTVWTPVGHFPDVRAINIENLSPSQTLTLGADQWVTFPMTEKKLPGLLDNLPNSGYMGLAYLKVP